MIISLQIWGLQDDFNGGKQSGISWCDLPEKDYIRCNVLVSLWRTLKESIAYLLRMILKIWIIEIFVQKKKYETVCYRPAKCKTVYLRPSCKENESISQFALSENYEMLLTRRMRAGCTRRQQIFEFCKIYADWSNYWKRAKFHGLRRVFILWWSLPFNLFTAKKKN